MVEKSDRGTRARLARSSQVVVDGLSLVVEEDELSSALPFQKVVDSFLIIEAQVRQDFPDVD